MVSIKRLERQGLYRPQFEHDACGIGFVANIKGIATHQTVLDGLEMLINLDHRAGKDADGTTGDGTGLMFQLPHQFFCKQLPFTLPEPGNYAVGMCFLPENVKQRRIVFDHIKKITEAEGLEFLGIRDVPIDTDAIEMKSLKIMPAFAQVFIKTAEQKSELEFNQSLYRVRKQWEKVCGKDLYVASLSNRTIVYKGMLTAAQIPAFFSDLTDDSFLTAFAMVHSRYSTNTFPSWKRAHPNRYIAHNGEINTVRGNINDFKAQLRQIAGKPFANGVIRDLFPVIDDGGSDSQAFDAVLEFLLLTGRTLPEALMMMIPEPVEENHDLSPALKNFYSENSRMMSPWDGPMAISVTNGLQVGAILDRNGLRPGRYYLTVDDRIIFSSEAGVLDIAPEKVKERHLLKPGELLYIDLEKKEWVSSATIKEETARACTKPDVQKRKRSIDGDKRPCNIAPNAMACPSAFYQRAFGYTYEEVHKVLRPMAEEGKEPTGAMGVDTPLAVLSDEPKLLFDYFKQWFSQVTNPPIDAIRESFVISTAVWLGEEPSLLSEPAELSQLQLKQPVLTQHDVQKIEQDFSVKELDITVELKESDNQFEEKLEELMRQAEKAIRGGTEIVRLSDQLCSEERVTLPVLLVVSAIHHDLMKKGLRKKASLVLHTGEARDSHHMALLLSFGADAVYPYLGIQTIRELVQQGHILMSEKTAVKSYVAALTAGIVKIMSKVGISCIQSFKGAQTFEALGISQDLLDKYFKGTVSQLDGLHLTEIEHETKKRYLSAINSLEKEELILEAGSELQWRKEGETHLFQPMAIHTLQHAARKNDPKLYKKFTKYIDEGPFTTIRSLLKTLKENRKPVPIEEVESVEAIFKRFKTGAMSYGALSQEAHEALAIAMNRIGGKSNSGEGGESELRYEKENNGDWKRSAIKQVASGRFGVTSQYLTEAEEIQIKMAQGAKPGEGGQLPGSKVYPWIAEVRGSTPGVGLISPPPHHDIYSIEDLAQLIYDLKQANPSARISVKLVAKAGVGTIAAGVAKGLADVILISGHDGGTGASPVSSIKHAGLPWEIGLAETHQTLMLNGLRDKVVIETDGKLMTGRDVIIAACLGAEEFGFSTAPLIAMGCIMMRACHLDTCPVGVATQNPELRKKFMGTPDHIVNYLTFIAEDIREHLAELGFRRLDELIGRSDLLSIKPEIKTHWKAKHLELKPLFLSDQSLYKTKTQGEEKTDEERPYHFDVEHLLSEQVNSASFSIQNTDRTVGTRLGHEMTKRGTTGISKFIQFIGTAGQSFGAFIPSGLNLTLHGDANDYTGKGLSGGRLIIQPDERWLNKENQAIVGNVALYGATSGRAFIRGRAGQRFAVRNSGAEAVVEGIGDHGCEYMTGGRVLVIGNIGKNFAAGMSGGIAYLINNDIDSQQITNNINQEMAGVHMVRDLEESKVVFQLLKDHYIFTGSQKAKVILSQWPAWREKILKVVPYEYEKMQQSINHFISKGLTDEKAKLEAFYQKKSGGPKRTEEKTFSL